MAWIDGERLRTLEEAQIRLTNAEPFLPDAERMAATYTRLSSMALSDLEITAGNLFTEATQAVERERRQDVVAEVTGRIAMERGAAIEAEIRDTQSAAIQASEEKRFAEEEEPGLRRSVEKRVTRDLTKATRERLQATRPAELEAAFIAEHGDRIVAEETERYNREDAVNDRRQAEDKAMRNLTQKTRQALRDQAQQQGEEAAHTKAMAKEILSLRIERMQEIGKHQSQIPLSHLEYGDVITVQVCPENTSYNASSSNITISRELRFSIIDPQEAIVRVMDDSWRASGKEPALIDLSFKSGTLLTLQAAEELAKPVKERVKPTLMRSVPLHITHDGTDATSNRYEIHRVKMQTADGEKTLLGPAESRY